MIRLLLLAICITLATSQCPNNIVKVAMGNPQLSTLVSLVIKANLTSALSACSPKLTVLAPLNQAFVNANLGDPTLDQVSGILTYHVIPSEFYFNETTSITTLNGGALDVVYDSSTKKATINNYAVIDTSSPIITDNGIVFPLAAHVMIPPCGFQSFATLIDTAKAVPELSTLVSLIVKADLASILSGPGPFTVFAPTNDAFAALNLPADLTPAAIAKVLTYHVVSGRVLSSDLGASQSVPTFDEQPLSITVDNGKVNINEYSQVVTANIETCNAVVHVVNEVLIAKNGGPFPTIAGLAAATPTLSTLAKYVVQAGLGSTLSNPDAELTVFAPSNEAFANYTGVPAGCTLKDVLELHVLAARVLSSQLLPSQTVKTVLGQQLTITVADGSVSIVSPGQSEPAKVISANNVASNGIVHVIDRVLQPSSCAAVNKK